MADPSTQGDGRRLAVILILALWALAWGLSVVLFLVLDPAPEGYAIGMNSTGALLGWQAIAACLAIAAHGVARGFPAGTPLRRAALVPLGLALAAIAGVIAAMIFGVF